MKQSYMIYEKNRFYKAPRIPAAIWRTRGFFDILAVNNYEP
jgi:hypothetical protein